MVLKVFHSYIPLRRIAFFVLEGVSLIFIISLLIPFSMQNISTFIYQAAAICVLIQGCLFYFEMYEANTFKDFGVMAKRLVLALVSSFLVLLILFSPAKEAWFDGLVIALAAMGVTCAFWRILYRNWTVSAADQKLLIIGSGALAKNIALEIIGQDDCGFKVLGFVSEEPGRTGEKLVNPCIVADYSSFLPLVSRLKIDRVIVAVEDRRGNLPTDALLECKLKGIRVDDGFNFFERLTGKLSLEALKPSSIIFSAGFSMPRWKEFARRVISVSISLIALVIFAPLALVTAILIKLDSPGPALYRQERVGMGEIPFTLLKFRSMRIDAEDGVPVWASNDDPRVTRVGKWIRKLRLDEIPQLWNVIRNDMALVGPRPERPYFVNMLKKDVPYYGRRFAVKPGITGWAQISYAYGASKEESLEKLKYDLFYIKHRSISFDLYIIMQTAKIMFFRRGSR